MNLVPQVGRQQLRGQAFFNNAGDWSRGNNLDRRLAPPPGPNRGDARHHQRRTTRSVLVRRPDQEGPAVVLRQLPQAGHADARWKASSPTRTPQRRALGLGGRRRLDARQLQGRQMSSAASRRRLGKNRSPFNHEYQHRCEGSPLKVDTEGCHTAATTGSPRHQRRPRRRKPLTPNLLRRPVLPDAGPWTAPMTNKLLLEAGFTAFRYNPLVGLPAARRDHQHHQVTEQSTAINPATGIQYAPRRTTSTASLDSWGGPSATPTAGTASTSVRHRRAQHEGRLPGHTGWISSIRR